MSNYTNTGINDLQNQLISDTTPHIGIDMSSGQTRNPLSDGKQAPFEMPKAVLETEMTDLIHAHQRSEYLGLAEKRKAEVSVSNMLLSFLGLN